MNEYKNEYKNIRLFFSLSKFLVIFFFFHEGHRWDLIQYCFRCFMFPLQEKSYQI